MADDELIPYFAKSVVRARGEAWAAYVVDEMRRRRRAPPPWPAFGGTVAAKARAQVLDLLPLDAVGAAIVKACYEAAKEKYEELTRA